MNLIKSFLNNKRNPYPMDKIHKIRKTIVVFITLLMLSGITAFPLQYELNVIVSMFQNDAGASSLPTWFLEVTQAVNHTNDIYPFLAYGTDWLAFAHIIIGLFFIGVYINPIRNIWITKVGIIACLLVFPVTFIAGYIREIPMFWQMIDCCFGALGLIPLITIHKLSVEMENNSMKDNNLFSKI